MFLAVGKNEITLNTNYVRWRTIGHKRQLRLSQVFDTHLEVLHFVKKLEQLGDRVVLLAPADQKGIGWRLSMPQASSTELIQVDLGKIEQVKTF